MALVGGGSDIDAAADRLGLPVELLHEADAYQGPGQGIYPDNVQAVALFSDLLTQWRVGMSGAIGIDYSALPVVMRIRAIDIDDCQELFECLQIMERAALSHMRE